MAEPSDAFDRPGGAMTERAFGAVLQEQTCHRRLVCNSRQGLFATAVRVAAQEAKHAGFEAENPIEAFATMRPGEVVFVPRQLDGQDIKFNLPAASIQHSDKHDLWPGATCVFPMTTYQWHRLLATWALDSGWELADFVSDNILCLSLFIETVYSPVPQHVKIAYVVISQVSFLLEMWLAWRVLRLTDDHWLREVRHRHGVMEHITTVMYSLLLRYLSLDVRIDKAAINYGQPLPTFDVIPGGGCLGANVSNVPDVPAWTSEVGVATWYSERAAFIVKLPRVLLEDLALVLLMSYMIFFCMEDRSVLAISKQVKSMHSVGYSVYYGIDYVRSLVAYHRYLVSAMQAGDPFSTARPSLQHIERNPVRRWLLSMCRQELSLHKRSAESEDPVWGDVEMLWTP